jgi:hypothetical protein
MFQILCALYGVMYVVELKSKWENWLDRNQDYVGWNFYPRTVDSL